jgi:ABC-type glycerol-3-phosphate transport system substrate-binding protein
VVLKRTFKKRNKTMKGQVMNIRKWSGIVSAVALIATLSACAPAAEDGAAPESELLIWDTGILGRDLVTDDPYVDGSFLHQMALEFEEANPGVTVTIAQQGGDITANAAAFQAASIAGTGPDIRVQYAGGPTTSFADFFVDLEPLIPAEILDSMAGQYVNREGFDSSGRLLGMTYGAGNLFVVFQNADVLTEAGVDPSVVPATWDDLIANAQQVADNTEKTGFYTGNLEGYPGAWFISAMVGGELGETAFTDMYSGKVAVDDPAMLKAYQAFADWGASSVNNPDAAQAPASGEGFYAGEAAYYLVGSWENNGIVDAFGADGPVTSFFIPTLTGSPFSKIGAGGPEIALSITESSQNKELASEFLQFLARPEHQDRFVEIFQTQGSNHVDGDSSKIQNPRLQEQFEQLAVSTDGVTFAFDSVMPQATIDLFYRVNAGVFSGSITPEDAVAQLKASYEDEISK